MVFLNFPKMHYSSPYFFTSILKLEKKMFKDFKGLALQTCDSIFELHETSEIVLDCN